MRKYLPAEKLPPALLLPVKPLKPANGRPSRAALSATEPIPGDETSSVSQWLSGSIWAEALASCGDLWSALRCFPCVAPATHAFAIVLDDEPLNPLQAGRRRLGQGLAKAGQGIQGGWGKAGQGIQGAVSRTGDLVSGAQQTLSREMAEKRERRDERKAERDERRAERDERKAERKAERVPKGEQPRSKAEPTFKKGEPIVAPRAAPMSKRGGRAFKEQLV